MPGIFNAGKYLRLLNGRPGNPKISQEGRKFVKLNADQKFTFVRSVLANSRVFRECANFKIEDMENISDILKRYHPDLSSLSVVNRRAQTIRSWLIALGMHK